MEQIDLIIPTKNSIKTLPFTLYTIIRSKIPVNRLIIVDGGSTDGTLEFCEGIATLIIDDEGKGLGHARQLGLEAVETPVFASIDTGVFLPRDWFQKLGPQMDEEDLAVISGASLFGKPGCLPLRRYWEYKLFERKSQTTTLCNCLMKTDLVKKVGGFNSLYLWGEDQDLRDRLLEAGFEWRMDRSVIVNHYRTLLEELRQVQKWSYYMAIKGDPLREVLNKFLLMTFRDGPILMFRVHPTLLFIYPLRGFMWTRGYLKNLRRVRENGF